MRFSKPKLSVIIPTYNRAKYLGQAIDSVLSQRDPGFKYEVIVVDDGSTDNTQLVLKKYGDKIRLVALPHSGRPAVVRNAGLAVARGEFIAFQDSDDLWTTNKLVQQVQCFEDPTVVAGYDNAEYINKVGKKSGKLLIQNGKSGDLFDELTARTKQPLPTNTVIVRREVLNKIGGFNERFIIGTDTECWIRLSTQGKFRYVEQVLGYVRRHGDNISIIPSEKKWLESIFSSTLNRIKIYQSILDNYSRLLGRRHLKKLQLRVLEAYGDLALVAEKLSLAKEDDYRRMFHESPKVRWSLFWRRKRSLYFAHSLRVISRLHRPTHRKLIKWRNQLRVRHL